MNYDDQIPGQQVQKRILSSSAGAGGGGVTSLNALDGVLTLTAGDNINIVSAGTDIAISASDSATVTAHIADSTIHFTEGSIDHTAIQNIGTNSHAAIDTHIADSTIHFTEASIDHTAIQNIGTNSHAAIDTHIADSTIHFTEGSIDHGSIGGLTDDDHTQYLLADGTRALSADWDVGANSVRALTFAADVTTGTPPFLVFSTTVVSNLNADLLDGVEASALLLISNIDDVPVDGETSAPISSNWAFDHDAAADPHTGYRLESADHNHQSTGLQAGQLDHGAALTGLSDDDHTQYALLAGRSGGQDIIGGTAASNNLTLESTSNATKGEIQAKDNFQIEGQAFQDAVTTSTPSGTTQTIDWDNGNVQVLDLGSASGNVTLTLSNPEVGGTYTLKIIQGATARTLVWPAAVLWPGGTAITLSTGDNDIDLAVFIFIGTDYLGHFGDGDYS